MYIKIELSVKTNDFRNERRTDLKPDSQIPFFHNYNSNEFNK